MRIQKWVKWTVGIILGIMVILLALSWYISRQYKTILRDKLSERVNKDSQGLYRLSMGDIGINLLTGSASFRDVKLESDSSVYHTLLQAGKAPANRFEVAVHTLDIVHVNLWKWLVSDELSLSRIVIDTGSVQLIKGAISDSTQNAKGSLYDKIKDTFKEVHVGGLEIGSLRFRLDDNAKSKADPLLLDRVHVKLTDFLLNAASEQDSLRVFYSTQIVIDIPEFAYAIPNSVYRVAFKQLHLDSKKRSALLLQPRLEPRIAKEVYFRNDKENKALIFLNWDTLRLENWHMEKLFREDRVYAEKGYLSGGEAIFRKDKRYQKDNVNKIGQAPHQQIMKLQQLICIDTLRVQHTDLSYRQINENGDGEGIITFQQARGIITNLTNDTLRLRDDKYMRADLRANLMGKGLLHAVFGFDMLSKNGHHSYKGSLGQMQAPAFNRILTPLINLEIASGNIRRIRFDMQGNDFRNWGEFRFDYDDFKINILREPSDEGKRTRKGILSFFVNKFVLNDSNPDANEVYHIGQVDHTRVPEYSHFKTIWKSLQDGIAQCAGIDSKWLREKM